MSLIWYTAGRISCGDDESPMFVVRKMKTIKENAERI